MDTMVGRRPGSGDQQLAASWAKAPGAPGGKRGRTPLVTRSAMASWLRPAGMAASSGWEQGGCELGKEAEEKSVHAYLHVQFPIDARHPCE